MTTFCNEGGDRGLSSRKRVPPLMTGVLLKIWCGIIRTNASLDSFVSP